MTVETKPKKCDREIEPEQMTVEKYAAVRSALGDRVKKVGEVYWTLSRKFFWRPLLSYEAYAPDRADTPRLACAGYQHIVPDERDANSSVGYLILDAVQEYALERLGKKRRYLISAAAKKMEIRPVRDLGEFQEKGFAAYSSFYDRTSYRYMASRRRKANFYRWAETLLRQPEAMVLGAYGSNGLAAVSVSYWVEETLIYGTYFSESEALRQGAGELMFHTLRQIVARTPGIQQVIIRRYQGGNGIDQYYLLRGATLVRKPTRLRLQSGVEWFLKYCLPKRRAILYETSGNGA